MAHYLVLTTCADKDEARALASHIVAQGLGACVQLHEITSVYTWKGEVHDEPETILYIKTPARRYPELEKAIRDMHSYDVPEIVAIPIEKGLPAYLSWMDEACA
jgi:periplasmic divalent cation tolerance protein